MSILSATLLLATQRTFTMRAGGKHEICSNYFAVITPSQQLPAYPDTFYRLLLALLLSSPQREAGASVTDLHGMNRDANLCHPSERRGWDTSSWLLAITALHARHSYIVRMRLCRKRNSEFGVKEFEIRNS